MYAQVLVSYDISDTKNRNKLFEDLKDLGLRPIQKSVFWGYLLVHEKRIIKKLFRHYCDKDCDRAFIINATLDKDMSDSFGYDSEDFKHPNSFKII